MKKYILITFYLFISCSSEQDSVITGGSINNDNTSSEWSIPVDEIFEGAGRDGIPSIDNPVFLSGQNSFVDSFLNSDDLVIGVKIGNETRAYPHKILDWHEIVNDEINGQKMTINYCPLTRTGFVWKVQNLSNYKFGVSGLLYNSNLIMYDRETNSNWSQMSLMCVNGDRLGDKPILENLVEVSWGEWKKMYPNTKVLGSNQGFDRDYNIYPYGGYLNVDDFLFFPVSPKDSRLNNKERVYCVLNGENLKAYRFSSFKNGSVIKDEFEGNKYLIVGNNNVIKSYILPDDLQTSIFSYSYQNSEEFFSDNGGNKWSVFGEAIEGPLKGRKLKSSISVTGFWFSVASFYPNPEIYQ